MRLVLLSVFLLALLVNSFTIKNIKSSSISKRNLLLNNKQKVQINRSLQLASTPTDILLIDANFNLAAGSLVVGTICGVLENFKGITARLFGAGAIAFTIFGGFLTFQTSTLRFKFSEDSFALVKADGSSNGENIVVGGENSWKYKSFVNYDFLPSESFPILVYFKETQTPEDLWVETPIIVDQLKGQQHFFPAIADVQQLKQNFESHGCKKASRGPVSIDLDKKIVL